MDMRLEVVEVPVADVDRAKSFYQTLGWRLDADFAKDGFRVVQFTPPGSGCSIIFGSGVTSGARLTDHLVLAVPDIDAARQELLGRGIDVGEVFHDKNGVYHRHDSQARVPGPDPRRRSYCSWASFSDPDGNSWLLQEIKQRLPGRA